MHASLVFITACLLAASSIIDATVTTDGFGGHGHHAPFHAALSGLGGKCGGAVWPPRICAPGLRCAHSSSGIHGAPGHCVLAYRPHRPHHPHRRGGLVGEGRRCGGRGVHRRRCKHGLVCKPKNPLRPGRGGVCVRRHHRPNSGGTGDTGNNNNNNNNHNHYGNNGGNNGGTGNTGDNNNNNNNTNNGNNGNNNNNNNNTDYGSNNGDTGDVGDNNNTNNGTYGGNGGTGNTGDNSTDNGGGEDNNNTYNEDYDIAGEDDTGDDNDADDDADEGDEGDEGDDSSYEAVY